MFIKKSWLEAQMKIIINCFTSENTVEQTIQCVGKNKFSFMLSSTCFRKSTFIKDGKKSDLFHPYVCVVVSDSLWFHDCNPPGSSDQEFSRQEYWSGLPFPTPGNLPNQISNLSPLHLLHWQEDYLPLYHLRSSFIYTI